jgi:hypothetical protein
MHREMVGVVKILQCEATVDLAYNCQHVASEIKRRHVELEQQVPFLTMRSCQKIAEVGLDSSRYTSGEHTDSGPTQQSQDSQLAREIDSAHPAIHL